MTWIIANTGKDIELRISGSYLQYRYIGSVDWINAGELSSFGVSSVNGLTGGVTLKTINSTAITGSGDIEIESSGHIIQDEGTPLTERANLNFVGSGITVTDDSGNNATVVTVTNTGLTPQNRTTNFTAIEGNQERINTTSGVITATLPASPTGSNSIEFIDVYSNFGTNELIIDGNGNTIVGYEEITLDRNNESVKIRWDVTSSEWIIESATYTVEGFVYTGSEVTDHIADIDNPHQVTKAQIGLSNADNTSDTNKPISDATQTALNNKEGSISAGTTSQYWRGDKSWQTLDKSAVGLSNVPNTDCSSASNISTGTLARARASNHFIEKHFTGTLVTGTYRFFVSAHNATVIGITSARTTSGTATLNILKNGTLITGLDSIAVSSSELSSDDLATALNTVVKGDRIQIEIASVSSAIDLFVQVEVQLS